MDEVSRHLAFKSVVTDKNTKTLGHLRDDKDTQVTFKSLSEVFNCHNYYHNVNLRFSLATYPPKTVDKANKLPYLTSTLYKEFHRTGKTNILGIEFDNLTISESSDFVNLFCRISGLSLRNLFVMYSGNGLHFYIPTADSLSIEDYDILQKELYGRLYDRLCLKAKIPVKNRDMPGLRWWSSMGRIPLTINEKRDKTSGKTTRNEVLVLNAGEDESPWSWAELIRLLTGTKINIPGLVSRHKVSLVGEDKDNETLTTPLATCDFIRQTIKQVNNVKEPQLFNAFRILANDSNGEKLALHVTKYRTNWETETALDKYQRAKKYRNVTCSHINATHKNVCPGCPHFRKIIKPAQLITDNKWQAARDLRFRTINKKGDLTNMLDYELLLSYLADTYGEDVRVDRWGGNILIYNTTHWKSLPPQLFTAEIVIPLTGIFGDKQKAVTDSIYRCVLDSWPKASTAQSLRRGELQNNLSSGTIDINTENAAEHKSDSPCDFVLGPHS